MLKLIEDVNFLTILNASFKNNKNKDEVIDVLKKILDRNPQYDMQPHIVTGTSSL